MPPEQAKGRRDEVDARSDVWGFGATLFTAITGRYVHDASTLHEQLIASATLQPRSVRALAPHDPALDRGGHRSRARAREDRSLAERTRHAACAACALSRHAAIRIGSSPRASPCPLRRCAVRRRPGRVRVRRARSGSSLPSSDQTLKDGHQRRSSDPTIEDTAPPTEQTLFDALPSSGGPLTPPPHTERIITGILAAPQRPDSSRSRAANARITGAVATRRALTERRFRHPRRLRQPDPLRRRRRVPRRSRRAGHRAPS